MRGNPSYVLACQAVVVADSRGASHWESALFYWQQVSLKHVVP